MSKTQRPDDQFRDERLIKQRLRELENSLHVELLTVGVDISFGANWGNPDAGYSPPYCWLNRGWVYFGGTFKKLTSESMNANPMCVLPDAFQPGGIETFITRFGLASGNATTGVHVLSNGEVRTNNSSTTPNIMIGMGGVHFRVVS